MEVKLTRVKRVIRANFGVGAGSTAPPPGAVKSIVSKGVSALRTVKWL